MYALRTIKNKILVMICVIVLIMSAELFSFAKEPVEPGSLYATAAVLMDGDTGRVLYEKNGNDVLPMASTTKVMTLIVALENSNLDDIVNVSSYAASMPDVQLGICEGEQYILKDLLYSLMLESHNDVAVAIAEHIGGSVEGYAELMNEKAEQLGCTNTYFITPNGLDASDTNGVHSTTAKELSLIMAYAIKNPIFLEITQRQSYSFSDISGKRIFNVNNKNALLTMEPDVISGKTGFTNGAGYCYTCAFQSEGRTFILSLLGCGWPPNKSWKWTDCQKLIVFAKENYELREIGVKNRGFEPVDIIGGMKPHGFVSCDSQKVTLLVGKHEDIKISTRILTQARAPIKEGQWAGQMSYTVDDQVLYQYPIVFKENILQKDFQWYWKGIWQLWCP